MRSRYSRRIYWALAAWGLILPITAWAQLPSFNGAEGFGGTFIGTPTGGAWFSNAEIYHVTTTEDIIVNGKGAKGTLRGAFVDFTQPNSPKQKATDRIVVFDVGGTFELKPTGTGFGKLDMKEINNIYIAGQTAPSPVTVYGNMAQITKSDKTMTSNVILRYMTFRKGTGPEEDALSFVGGDGPGDSIATNMILDHVTTSWSEDENLSVSNNNTNVTVQYSIIHDALINNHAYGSLIRPKVNSNVTFHHNLYANNASRQARFGSYRDLGADGVVSDDDQVITLTADFRNNVVYNWRDRASYSGGSPFSDGREAADVNYVGNYLIAGPKTQSYENRAFLVDRNIDTKVYQSANAIDSDKTSNVSNPGGLPNGSNTGWGMFETLTDDGKNGVLTQLSNPLATSNVTVQSASDAYEHVVKYAGNYWWARDEIDSRVIDNVTGFTSPALAAAAPIDSELNLVTSRAFPNAPSQHPDPANWDTENMGNWPGTSVPKPKGDGMPTWWELQHGLDPNVNDALGDFDNDGYVNVQEYLDEIGAIPAPSPLTYVGPASGAAARYALISNWKTASFTDENGKVFQGSNWQPSRFDEARINGGTVVVESVGQHAGLLVLGANAGNNATLNITGGWLKAEDAVVIGGSDAATARINLTGGMLSTPVLAKGDGGTFSFTGGTLQATTIGFALHNQGGTFAPGQSIADAYVMGNLTLSSGSLQIEVDYDNLTDSLISDTLLVDGTALLGGSLNVVPLAGFTPSLGDHWPIITAHNIDGSFLSVTSGYSVQKQGDTLMLYFGAAPPLALTGDYNNDGTVDAADYVLWRKASESGGSLQNETDNPGTVDEGDFGAWKGSFGGVDGGGSDDGSGNVPEPGGLALLSIGATLALYGRRRSLRISGHFLQ